MASDTEVRLDVKGVDKTRQAFASAGMRLARFAAQSRVVGLRIASGLTHAVSGALNPRAWRNAALGVAAAMGGPIAAIRQTANALSALSDRAAQAGVSSEQLQKFSSGLAMLGAKNANVETLSEAFSRMTKATGRVGAAGFRETLEEISKLGSEEERVKALAETLGRSFGPGLAALVRQGPDALRDGLFNVVDAMPAVQERLVEHADGIADGFAHATENLKAGWQSAWMDMASRAAESLGMTDRELGIVLGAELRKHLEIGLEYFKMWAANVYKIFNNFPAVWRAVFVDYLGGLLAEGLLKAGAKIVEWAQKTIIRFRQVYEVVKALFTDDTVEGANARAASAIAAATRQYEATFDLIGERFADNTFAKMRSELEGLGLRFTIPEETRQAIQDQYDRTVASVAAIEEASAVAAGAAASGVAETATRAASQISDKFRDAMAVSSRSYTALKIARASADGGSAGIASGAAATSQAARASAQNARNTATILSRIVDLLTVQREGWAGLRPLTSNLGVV